MSFVEVPLPSVEEQNKLVEQARSDLKAIVLQHFQGDEHKPFRLMVKTLAPNLEASPASGTTRYHGAWAGGLLVHTVEVIKMALKIAEMVNPDLPLDGDWVEFQRSIVRAGFLHDLGKIGDGEVPYYLPQDNDWRREKLGETYQINRDLEELTFLPVPIRGLWIAQKSGVYLTQEEIQAVMSSDGPQTEMGKVVTTVLETPLTMIVHFADKWVSQIRKT